LSGCSGVPVRPLSDADGQAAQSARETLLTQRVAWSFVGRIAVSQGAGSGNARIEWRQDGADFELRLSAPLTRQSWRLHRLGGRARLEGLDAGLREGDDAERLLSETTGWSIPIDAMAAWVRGVRGDGPAVLAFDAQGLPATIAQRGWTIEYRGWNDAFPPMPRKIFAEKEGAKVRLAIESWGEP